MSDIEKEESETESEDESVDSEDSEESSGEEDSDEEDSRYVSVPHKDERWSKPIHSGFLSKYSSNSLGKKIWVNRFFILNADGKLWRFKTDKKKNPLKKQCIVVKGNRFWKSNVRRYCIEIEQEKKAVVLYAKSMDVCSTWVMKFQQAGGIFDSIVVNRHITPEISRIMAKKWDTSLVADWLHFVPLSFNENLNKYEKEFKSVDGKKLLTVDDYELRKMRVRLFSHRRIILRSIKILQTVGVFNHDYHIVLKKIMVMIEKNRKKNSNFRLDINQQHKLAKNLSDPESMMNSYLHMGCLNDLIEGRKAFADDDNSDDEQVLSSDGEDSEREGELLNFRKELKECDSQSMQDVKRFDKSGIPVKLIITEVARTKRFKSTRKLLSPIISHVGKLRQEFGMFHSALLIGPWYLEWNDSSLVIPRRPSSNSALIAADIKVEDCLVNFGIEEMVKKISEVVCVWNTRKFYDRLNMKKLPTVGNCQEFVENIMMSLGINVEYGGSFGKFLKSLREKGTCEMIFSPSRKFRKGFKMKKKQVTFKTHRDLDEFVLGIKKRAIGKFNGSLAIVFPWEFRLLKSFDRAFWLRHLKNKEDAKYAPLPCQKKKLSRKDDEDENDEDDSDDSDDNDEFETGCPFQDPRKTLTYC